MAWKIAEDSIKMLNILFNKTEEEIKNKFGLFLLNKLEEPFDSIRLSQVISFFGNEL